MRWVCRWIAIFGVACLGLVGGPALAKRSVRKKPRITRSKPKVRVKKQSNKRVTKKRSASPKRVRVKRKTSTPTRRKSNWVRRKKGGTTNRTRTQSRRNVRPRTQGSQRNSSRRQENHNTERNRGRADGQRGQTPVEQDRANWRRTRERVRQVVRGGGFSRGTGGGRQRVNRSAAASGRRGPASVEVGVPRSRRDNREVAGGWIVPPRISGDTEVRPAEPAPERPEPSRFESRTVYLRPQAEEPLRRTPVALAPPPTNLRRSGLMLRSTRNEADWFEGVGLDASVSNWVYQPFGTKGGPEWANTTTTEVYEIDPAMLWHVGLRLDTRWVRLQANYESDVGFDFGGRASLLNVLVALSGFEHITFEFRRMDFDRGQVALQRGGETIELADFSTELTRGELRYFADNGMFVFGRAQLQGLPRNVYLEESSGGESRYFQISDQLLQIETEQYMLGFGWSSVAPMEAANAEGFSGGVHFGFGLGPYTIHTLAEHQYLDEGWLASVSLGGEIAWRTRVSEHFSVGVRDRLVLNPMAPIGLPDDLKRDLRRDGIDTDGYSLDFGTVDLLNEVQLFVALDL